MTDLKAFLSAYKSAGHKFVPFISDDNDLSELDSTKVMQNDLNAVQQLLKSNSLVFLCEMACNQSWLQFIESYLLCRCKPTFKNNASGSNTQLSWKLDQLVFLVYLRLCSATELDSICELLPSAAVNALAVATNAGGKRAADNKDKEASDPIAQVTDQYKAILSTMTFLRVPCVMDVISILGDSGSNLSSRLLRGLNVLRPSFEKETADTLKETVKALKHVQQSVIILSRKVLDNNKTKSILGKAKVDTKISNLSVVSLQRSQSSQDKAGKQTAAEELSFLCEFAADIVYSVASFLAALSDADLLITTSSLFCLGGTRLTGKLGQPFVLALRNLYEVVLPLMATCLRALPDIDRQQVHAQLGIMQLKSLSMLHCLLRSSHGATAGLLSTQQKSFEELFDSMDVLREDGIEWLALLQGYDPLGKDPLVLTAVSGNSGDSGSSKVVSASGAAAKGPMGGVTHTVDETEVLRGAFISDLMKIYGASEVEGAVRHSSAGDSGAEQVTYIVKSLQSEESLLQVRKPVAPAGASSAAMSVAAPASTARSSSSGKAGGNSPLPNNAEAVRSIKSIFPDLGEGFIEACLAAYKGNVEEIIDALLSDNLQPSLLVLDRSLQKMWIGKGGGAAQGAISLDAQRRDASVVYKAVEDANFKQLQLERLQKMEAQLEYDHMLLSREYNDDYDDQYDEFDALDLLRAQPGNNGGSGNFEQHSQDPRPVPAIPSKRPLTAGPTATSAVVSTEILNRRERRKNKGVVLPVGGAGDAAAASTVVKTAPAAAPLSKAAILQQMAEMKRFNSLTRDAEAEAAYWDSMRNTNKHSSATSGKNSWKAELAREEAEEGPDQRSSAQPVGGAALQQRAAQLQAPPKGAQTKPGQAPAAQSGAGQGSKQASGRPQHSADGRKNNQNGPNSQGKGDTSQPSNAAGPKGGKPARDGSKSKDGDAAQSVDGSVASGDSKKHRSKPYDKHHQKDRATRKFSHFAPSS